MKTLAMLVVVALSCTAMVATLNNNASIDPSDVASSTEAPANVTPIVAAPGAGGCCCKYRSSTLVAAAAPVGGDFQFNDFDSP